MARRRNSRSVPVTRSLPGFKWLLAGAVAAGVWVVNEERKTPRPPERVGGVERTVANKPAAAKPAAPAKPTQLAAAATIKPNPPRPPLPVPLPKTAGAPQERPPAVAAGAIVRPQASTRKQARTTTRVRVRARPNTDAAVVATLEPGHSVSELARSGAWRLVMANGVAGWVHADYLGATNRPLAAVPGKATTAKAKPALVDASTTGAVRKP